MDLMKELKESGKDIVVVNYNNDNIALLKPINTGGYGNILSGVVWHGELEGQPGVNWVIRYGDKCQMSDNNHYWLDAEYQGIHWTSEYVFKSSESHYRFIRPASEERIKARTQLEEAQKALAEARDAVTRAQVSLNNLN